MGDGVFGYRDPSTTATPFVNMGITMSGAYSGLKTGFVYELDEDYHVDTTGDGMTDTIINDTTVGTYTSASRDSGAPVLSGNSLVGMHIGTDGTHTRFIATSVIESEFSGLTWDY